MRTIEAPVDALKEMQRVILDRVLYPVYGAHYSAMGFVPHRGIRKNAEEHFQREHATKQTILKIDLKDCFPSIGSDVLYSNLLTQLLVKRNMNRWTSFADLSDYNYTTKIEHRVLKEYAVVNAMPGEIFSKLYLESICSIAPLYSFFSCVFISVAPINVNKFLLINISYLIYFLKKIKNLFINFIINKIISIIIQNFA